MSNTYPIYRSHAIKELIFALQFREAFDKDSLEKLIQSERLKSELPNVEKINETSSLAGVEFRHFKDDEKIDWMLRVHGNFISVNCLDYEGWKKVWSHARQYLEWVVKSQQNSLEEIMLQYVDLFVYEGQLSEYSLTELFDEKAPYLTQKIKAAGPLWHINHGWFDQVEQFQARCLNILNINTAQMADSRALLTQIEHRGQIQFGESITEVTSLFVSSDNHAPIDDIISYLHQNNKNIMLELLQPNMAKRLGLIASESRYD